VSDQENQMLDAIFNFVTTLLWAIVNLVLGILGAIF
jgi:hypothetical protein